jgi:hypothetical protein
VGTHGDISGTWGDLLKWGGAVHDVTQVEVKMGCDNIIFGRHFHWY